MIAIIVTGTIAATTAALAIGAATIGAGVATAAAISSSKTQKKAQKRAEEFAREQSAAATEEQARLEEKFGLTPGELAREERLFGRPARSAEAERKAFATDITQRRKEFESSLITPGGIIGGGLSFLNEKRKNEFEEQITKEQEEFEADLAIREQAGEFGPEEEGLEVRRQKELERRADIPGEELLREAGPTTQALIDRVGRRAELPGEELFREEGEIPRALQEDVLEGIREPGGRFESTLEGELELARQFVNAEANKRGVFGGRPEGGIRFENLGRAGVDLAIKSARERNAARQQDVSNASILANRFIELSAAARGEAGTVGERGLQEQERARAELANLVKDVQSLTAGARGRAANVGLGAAGITFPAQQAKFTVPQTFEAIKFGEAGETKRAALSEIGKFGGNILTSAIAPPGTAGIDAAGGSTLTAERGIDRDIFEDILGRAGRDVSTFRA